MSETDLIAALESGKVAGAALDVFAVEPLPADHPYRKQPNLILTPHLGASTEEAQEKCGIEVAEVIAGYLLTGEVRNAVNLPYLDAKTYEQVKPYLPLGEALGKLLAQLSPASADRLYITYGGHARQLPNIDPVTRAVLQRLSGQQRNLKDVNNVNVRSVAAEHRHHRRGKEIGRAGDVQRMGACAGFQQRQETDFGGRNLFRFAEQSAHRAAVQHAGGDSRSRGTLLLLNNKDRPGIVGHLGTLLGKHKVNIANMSLTRDTAGGLALTVLNLDSAPPPAVLEELQKDTDISNVKVVKL